MRHLLDTHSLIWALDDPSKLGRQAIAVLEDPANELVRQGGATQRERRSFHSPS